MMMNPMLVLAASLALLGAQPLAEAKSLVNTGGSCSSQGVWTTRALDQARLIISTAEQLKKDPDCTVLAEAITKVSSSDIYAQIARDDKLEGPGAKYESLPGDLMALRTVLMQNPNNATLNSRLSPVLAKSTVDLASDSASLLGPSSKAEIEGIKTRMKRTLGTGEALLSAVFNSLPQQQLCLQKTKNTEAGLNIISASIRMMAAFSSGSESTGQNLSALMQQFNTFLREMKYNKIINESNIAQFWTEMSCLIESTQQAYCSAKDGLQLLDYQAKEAQVMAELRENLAKGKVSKDSAIEGYLLLSREVITVTQWLQRVQSGVDPKTVGDANNKNGVARTVSALTENINLLQGAYNENLALYRGLSTVDQKQQNIRNLIRTIQRTVARSDANINFFVQAVNDEFLPFFLIGRASVPDEVLGRNNMVPMSGDKYLQDPARVGEFNNPDALMVTILERITSLSDLALREGSKYFAQNMSVDHVNLVDETLTDSSVTVYESLKNIRGYIARLAMKYAKAKGEDGKRLALSMSDTLARIDRVLRRFDAVNDAATQYSLKLTDGSINLADLSELPKDQQTKVRELYKNLITSVYDEFNLLLQREAFVGQRLSTYVRFDLFQRVRTKEDMSPYVQYLLVASGKNMMNRFQTFQDFKAAEVEADLSEAQRINRVNLDALEELFAGDVWVYLNKLSENTGNEYVKKYTDNPFRPLYSVVTDFHNVTWQHLRHFGYSGKRINQDEDGALSFLRAKVCTQTLGFKSWMRFKTLCRGAVLQSRMTAKAPEDLHLKASYDQMVKEKNYSAWESVRDVFGADPAAGKRYQHVCGLHEFFRNNQVYWLTLEFGAQTPEGNLPAPPADNGAANPF